MQRKERDYFIRGGERDNDDDVFLRYSGLNCKYKNYTFTLVVQQQLQVGREHSTTLLGA